MIKKSPLHGGDINQVFLLETRSRKMVVKINSANRFPGMFKKEADGLERLRETNSFKIPKVFGYSDIDTHSYLLLEWLSPGYKDAVFWNDFANNLATLHQNTSPIFGLEIDNYIGSLPQYNQSNLRNAAKFYIDKRLHPQFQLAAKQGFKFKNLPQFYQNLEDEIPDEKASLIHGDLWAGNFLCTEGNIPALIDPAVAYAPREMDIAMMKLFGGLPTEVFTAYNSIFPMEKAWENRIKIWQLYYLLVHLNLFGSGYLSQVKKIVSQFS